jgi:hypothetical protein
LIAEFETQTITIDSLSGPQKWPAPAGWDFDSTQSLVWVRLMNLYRTHKNLIRSHKTTKRDVAVMEGKMDALANILACTLGMAGFYWIRAAKTFVDHLENER